MIPVPPGAPAVLIPFLTAVADVIQELELPTYPHPLYRAASSALPPAEAYAGCVLDLTDINTLAKSDGTVWRRVDTGASL